MSKFRRLGVVVVCLGFTGASVAWAEIPRRRLYIDDPMAPHVTRGPTARLGTSVGFIFGEHVDVTAVGLTAAVGHRFDRLRIEAELTHLRFQEREPSHAVLGNGQRLGVIGRFDVLRLGPRIVGGNSMFAVYVEGGAAVAWNRWYTPAYDEGSRLVPADTKRVEAQTGFGVELDHRLQEPIGFPHRIAWFLGWRFALAPHDPEPASICRGVTCAPAPMMSHERYTNRSMLFQSSLAVTW